MTFDLKSVVPANQGWKPQKILIYGTQGLGKTSFGSTFEKSILARTEDGAGNVDCQTFPNIVSTFSDMENVINSLHGEHQFKTLVIDSLDWLEPIIWAKTVNAQPVSEKGHKIETIEDYGYGKGYSFALDWWRYLMGGFDSLRFNKGMTIALIAHAETKRYDSPETEPYDRYQVKIHKNSAALWQEWSDMVLFCAYKTQTSKTDVGFNKKVVRGVGTGERVIYTEERPAFLAKNRWGLPPEIYIGVDKTWSGFHEALNEATQNRYQPTIKKEKKNVKL